MNSITVKLQLEEKQLAEANKLTKKLGFSSIEETLRELVGSILSKSDKAEPVTLTKMAKNRYEKMDEDFKNGKNVHAAKNVDDFLAQLNA